MFQGINEYNVEYIQCVPQDFTPAFAIKMATNKNIMIRIKPLVKEIFLDERCASVLGGILNDDELENYKIAYSFVHSCEENKENYELFAELWEKEFPMLIDEITRIILTEIAAVNIADLMHSLSIRVEENTVRYQDIFCIFGWLVNAGMKLCFDEDAAVKELFGSYLSLFARDCNLDEAFSQFFKIKNTRIQRKTLIRRFASGEEKYNNKIKECQLDKKLLPSYDFMYKLDDIFTQAAAHGGLNPYNLPPKRVLGPEQLNEWDGETYKYYHIDDRLKLTEYEASLLNYIEDIMEVFQEKLLDTTINAIRKYAIPINANDAEVNDVKTNDDVPSAELIEEIKQLKEKNHNLKAIMAEKDERFAAVDSRLKGSISQINELEKKNRELEKLLYQALFNKNTEQTTELSEFAKKRLYESVGVIVGGHSTPTTKLLQYMPRWTVIENDNLVRNNWAAFKNAELVVVQTNYMPHGIYYQAMDMIEDKSKLIFTFNNNVDLILNKIIEKLDELDGMKSA